MQATGSLWNPNSWHWEMKNCSQRSRALLQERLLLQQITTSEGTVIKHTKINFIKADAEFNIRKGKSIYVFEFEMDFTLQCQYKDKQSEGSYRAKQILNDSLDDIIIDDIKAKQKNQAGSELKKWVKKNAKDFLAGIIMELQKKMLADQTDPKKIEENKKLREANLEAVAKAREQKGAEKQRLLAQQKAKEKQLKKQAELKDLEIYQSKLQNNILDQL